MDQGKPWALIENVVKCEPRAEKIGKIHILAGVCEVNKDTLTLEEREVPDGLVCQRFAYTTVRDVQPVKKRLTINTTERRIDAYVNKIVGTFLLPSRDSLTHCLINVSFQCRVLGISSLELLHNVRLIDVVIHDVNNCYNNHSVLRLDWEDM